MSCSAEEELTIMEHCKIFESNGFRFKFDRDAPPTMRVKLASVPFVKNVAFDERDVQELCDLINKQILFLPPQEEQDQEDENGKNSQHSTSCSDHCNHHDGSEIADREQPSDEVINQNQKKQEGKVGQEDITATMVIRPSKLSRIFASKACRTSVMFGAPLQMRDMTRIVSNLSTMNHPWNCPHGRPTMRHLCNLDQLLSDKYKKQTSAATPKKTRKRKARKEEAYEEEDNEASGRDEVPNQLLRLS